MIALVLALLPVTDAAWTRHTIDSGPRGADGVRPRPIAGPEGAKFDRIELVDLDDDGDLDLVTTEERDGLGVVWYENPVR